MKSAEMAQRLLPRPKHAVFLGGNVRLGGQSRIVVDAFSGSRTEEIAAALSEKLAGISGLRLAVERRSGGNGSGSGILLRNAAPGGFRFLPRPGSGAIKSPEEAYSLSASGEWVELSGITAAGLRHAVNTLLQLATKVPGGITIPRLRIEDWPSMAVRGFMEDVSRGKVPTLGTLKELASMLASWKINMLQLYVEHVFRFKRHPLIGGRASRLEPEEIVDLDTHCRNLGIDLVPNFASFGHMERIFEVPKYRKRLSVGEPHRLIMPLEEKTYRFLDELYTEFLPCFSSRYFNINCDETWDLGKGRSGGIVKRLGAGEVYLRHILRLYDLVTKKHGRRMMMWGDIIVRHPALIRRLPRDIIVLPWEYFGRWRPADLKPFKKAGLDFLVCPGTCAWHSPSPFVDISNVNIKSAAESSRVCGGLGILNTDWGDAGHQQPLGLSFYAMAFGAEQAWSGGTTPERSFDRAFSWQVFGDRTGKAAELYRTLGSGNHALRIPRKYAGWFYTVNFTLMFYMRRLGGKLLDGVNLSGVAGLRRVAERAERLIRKLKKGKAASALLFRELGYSAGLLSHLAAKLSWVLAVRSGERGRRTIRRGRTLIADLIGLKREFLAVWNARNRPRNREITLKLFDGTARFYRRVGRKR